MENKKGKLVLIIGPSGCGKSELANQIILTNLLLVDDKKIPSDIWKGDEEYYSELQKLTTDSNNSMFYAKKYVTRDLREQDVGVEHCDFEQLQDKCDVIVPGYKENDYLGFSTDELFEQIDCGKSPVIVTGFMQSVQSIMRSFMESERIQDIYIVGINSFLKDVDDYAKLEKVRYGDNYDIDSVMESAKSRFVKSRLFARGYDKYKGIIDYSVDNYRLKYIEDPDLRAEAAVITGIVSNGCTVTERNIDAVIEFINADLSKLTPVTDDEINFVGKVGKK